MSIRGQKEIHGTLPAATQRRVTTAVGLTEDGSTIIGSSEETLRRAQKALLSPGEIAAEGLGHAEETVINTAKGLNKKVAEMGARRPICSDCEELMKSKNIEIKSPTSGKKSRTRRTTKNDN